MRWIFIILILSSVVFLFACDTVEPTSKDGLWIGSVAGCEVTIKKSGVYTSVICYDETELTFLDVYDDGAYIKSRRGEGTFEYAYTINENVMTGKLDVKTKNYEVHGVIIFTRQ